MSELRGRACILTGGTAGIGLATATALVERGAKVVTCSRRSLNDNATTNWVHLGGDIAEPATSNRLVETCVQKWGRLDIAIANAGVGYFGGIASANDQQVSEMVATNLVGTIWLVRAAVNQFRRQGQGGDIIIVSSAAGYRGESFEAVYAATKHGQVGLAGALDRELADEGIRVTLVCPAGVATEFALGHGRVPGDPNLDLMLKPEDVADTIMMALEQSRLVRTSTWQFRSIHQPS